MTTENEKEVEVEQVKEEQVTETQPVAEAEVSVEAKEEVAPEAVKADGGISGAIQPSDGSTSGLEEAMAAAYEMHELSTLCDGDNANTRNPKGEGTTPEMANSIDDMRTAFYNTALNLFEAAKSLKPYDILYTDGILSQAQYFLNLADNYDTLHSLAKITLDMPLNKLSQEVPEEVIERIEDYTAAIKNRMSNMKNKAEISDEVANNVDEIANAIQAKLSGGN